MDKSRLFDDDRLGRRKVDVDGVGVFMVRSLSRAEVIAIQQLGDNIAAIEGHMLFCGIVDPELTTDEIQRWRAAAPATEVDQVLTAVAEMSGLVGDAPLEPNAG